MASLTEVPVPDIGDFTDVPIVEVLVAVGDQIEVEGPIVEIESDKASFEVPSPVAGTVTEVKVAVGDKVEEGVVLIVVDTDGGAAEESGGSPSEEGTPGDAGATKDSEVATGSTGGGDGAQPDESSAASSGSAEPSESNDVAKPADAGGDSQAASGPAPSSGSDPVYASPMVRRLARERGIDLRALAGDGSGSHGRITQADLDGGGRSAAPAAGSALEELGLAPWPKVDFEKFGPVSREPLSRIGKLSAANLARNWVRIPHVTHNDDADITDLEAFRKELNAEQTDVKVTMVALLLKASAAALHAFPNFNSSLDGDELVVKRYFHLGFAADTDQGLVVPVVRDVDKKGVLELAGEVGKLAAKARAGKLMPAEMSGGTFSVSSLGGIGGTAFTPIVNAPEVAILGAVRSVTKPVWNGKEFEPRLILPLSLSYDHRVIDGADAARFMVHLTKLLGDFQRVLL